MTDHQRQFTYDWIKRALDAEDEIKRLRAALEDIRSTAHHGQAAAMLMSIKASAALKGGEDGGEGNPAPGDWLRAQRLGER